MNYEELVTKIQETYATDDTEFVDNINTFIQAAEEKIFLALRGPLSWKTNSASTFSTGDPTATLPAGTIDVVDIYVIGPDANTDGQFLRRKDHSFLYEFSPLKVGSSSTGMPRFYCVETASASAGEPVKQIRVVPTPDANYGYSVSYYGKATADSITNGSTPAAPLTTNTWLSVAFPSILFYGAMLNAAIFMKSEPDIKEFYESQFNDGLTMLKNMTDYRQAGDEYSDFGKKDSTI